MYASIVGKKLVALTNQNVKKKLSVKEFWRNMFIPLFFDKQKYLLSGGNTPLENPKISWERKKYPNAEQRAKRIEATIKNIESGLPDTSNSLVAGSSDLEATTSGQITSLNLPMSQEDIYASWIGVGLGVRVEGGFVILFEKEEIINLLFEGWQKYRDLVDETPNLKGNQIETWNGHWLTFALGNPNYRKQKCPPTFIQEKGFHKIDTQRWIKVLFVLAREFPNEKLNTYIFQLNQTNTTIGFIQINLPEVKREIDMYNFLIKDYQAEFKKAIDDVYNTQLAFKIACQNGVIGLREIEPKDLRQYFPQINKEKSGAKIKKNGEDIINYNIYLSWVIAMLNNKDILELSKRIALTLIEYEANAMGGKSDRQQKVKKFLESRNHTEFLNSVNEIIIDDSYNIDLFNELIEKCMTEISKDNFKTFIASIRIQHTISLKIKENNS